MSQLRGSQNYIWSLMDVLGQGATGAVYRARHKKTGEMYAVKTFNQMSQMRPMAVQMREFDVLKKLDHENIVRLLAIEEETSTQSQILVMELCTGGSLYNMLDNPENAYGIQESEFFNILNDVACGMKHLQVKDIVHRDIKPGNIMRYIGEDGRSIFKLTDFGAARELQQEEEFMSLYGTEEYLFPDMYERAVLRRPSSKTFDATVDLWSLGVTLYHVATGQLPFRPFGGRKNKETMHRITAEKASGVISGVQETDGGPIIWSRDMPTTCRLSLGARRLVKPLLACLMESDPNMMWTFEKFFKKAQDIVQHQLVYVFDLCNCQMLHVFLDHSDSLMRFQDHLAGQADIHAKNQHLLFENCDFTKQVTALQPASTYPKTSEESPIFLLYNEQTDNPLQPEFDIPVIPPTPSQVAVETDATVAKTCLSIMYLTQRTISTYIEQQHLLSRAANMYLHVLSQQLEHFKSYLEQFMGQVEELSKRINLLESNHSLHIQTLSALAQHLYPEAHSSPLEKELQELEVTVPSLRQPFDQLWRETQEALVSIRQCYQGVVENRDLHPKWGSALGCVPEDRCESKMTVIVDAVAQTWQDFKKNKSLKKLSYNEGQIHKFEKHKMGVNCQKGRTLAENHCHPNLSQLFHKFVKWYSVGYRVGQQLHQQDSRVSKLQDTHAGLVYQLDQGQVEYQQKLQALIHKLRAHKPVAKKQNNAVAGATAAKKDDQVNLALVTQLQQTMQLVHADSVDVRNTLTDGMELLSQLNQKYASKNLPPEDEDSPSPR